MMLAQINRNSKAVFVKSRHEFHTVFHYFSHLYKKLRNGIIQCLTLKESKMSEGNR